MDEVLEKAQLYADKIYRDLEKTYDWYTSEECFEDVANNNDWRFDEKGDLV